MRTRQRQSRLHRNVGQALLLDVFQVLTVYSHDLRADPALNRLQTSQGPFHLELSCGPMVTLTPCVGKGSPTGGISLAQSLPLSPPLLPVLLWLGHF